MTAKTTAERQAEFKRRLADAGLVRVEFYASPAEREKFRELGGQDWVLRQIARGKIPTKKTRQPE